MSKNRRHTRIIEYINGRPAKVCTTCGELKLLSDFYQNEHNWMGILPDCKRCTTKHNYKNTSLNARFRRARSRIVKVKNLSLTEYQELVDSQNGVCAICKMKDKHMALHIDHDHNTNEIRGLLCKRCNSGIGMFRESLNIIKEAVNYLENNKDKVKTILDNINAPVDFTKLDLVD